MASRSRRRYDAMCMEDARHELALYRDTNCPSGRAWRLPALGPECGRRPSLAGSWCVCGYRHPYGLERRSRAGAAAAWPASLFEPRLSVDGRVSCATCHLPAHYASDSLPLSVGVLNRRTPRNVPTVLNASLNFVEHWRGDRASLEDQALKALTGPQSAGNPNVAVAQRRLRSLREYGPLFAAAFAEDSPIVSATHFAAAVAAYQRTLLTPSRFDRYLGGDSTVLLATERRGLRLFIDVGCVGCHNGPGVGGNSFRKFGVYQDYWQATGSRSIDLGRLT